MRFFLNFFDTVAEIRKLDEYFLKKKTLSTFQKASSTKLEGGKYGGGNRPSCMLVHLKLVNLFFDYATQCVESVVTMCQQTRRTWNALLRGAYFAWLRVFVQPNFAYICAEFLPKISHICTMNFRSSTINWIFWNPHDCQSCENVLM